MAVLPIVVSCVVGAVVAQLRLASGIERHARGVSADPGATQTASPARIAGDDAARNAATPWKMR